VESSDGRRLTVITGCPRSGHARGATAGLVELGPEFVVERGTLMGTWFPFSDDESACGRASTRYANCRQPGGSYRVLPPIHPGIAATERRPQQSCMSTR
jgi:hypothetical protein